MGALWMHWRANPRSTPRNRGLEGRWAYGGLPQGMPHQAAVPPPSLTSSSPEETPGQYSSSLQEQCNQPAGANCGAPATGHKCLCYLHQAKGTQLTAVVLTSRNLCLVWEK